MDDDDERRRDLQAGAAVMAWNAAAWLRARGGPLARLADLVDTCADRVATIATTDPAGAGHAQPARRVAPRDIN